MPIIMFTTEELVQTALANCRAMSSQLLELSDLDKKPLDPGEGVAARYHKIAKLGKQLAEQFTQLDLIIQTVGGESSKSESEPEPNKPNTSQAN